MLINVDHYAKMKKSLNSKAGRRPEEEREVEGSDGG